MKAKILYFVILITLTYSCKKDFLERTSESSLTKTTFFQSEDDFVKAVNACYAPLRNLYSNAWVMGELRSDNATYIYNPNDRGTIGPEQIADFVEEASNGSLSTKYDYNYLVIARANQVLALIDNISFDQTVKDNLKGQALFLRALCYFDLVQYFGRIPLHLSPASSVAETALPLSGIDTIYQQIITDAKLAASLLPVKSTQTAGRATSGAAKTLLANVYIVQKEWNNAISILTDAEFSSEYKLLTNYSDVYSLANKNSSESVFEIQYLDGTSGYASNFMYQFLPQPLTKAEVAAITGLDISLEKNYSIEGYNIPTPEMIAAYETGDLRKDYTIKYFTKINGVTYPYLNKYNHGASITNITGDNWPVYRYAEVLLFLAEAYNEIENTSAALVNLNYVRNRAGLTSSTETNQSALRELIMKERRVELAFENKRWLDLVRTGTATSAMSTFGASKIANPANYYYPTGYAPVSNAYKNIKTYFSIPSSESLVNPYF